MRTVVARGERGVGPERVTRDIPEMIGMLYILIGVCVIWVCFPKFPKIY